MLRQSLLDEAKKDWHPSVPSKKAIITQILEAKGRIGGSERLATMRISVGSKMPLTFALWMTNLVLCFKRIAYKIIKRLNGLK